MQVEQTVYRKGGKKSVLIRNEAAAEAQLVLVFGDKPLILDSAVIDDLRATYPQAYLLGCSTAGEIFDHQAAEHTLTATAIRLEKSSVRFASTEIALGEEYTAVSARLVAQLPTEGLRHVFVLSEGINMNGTALVAGFQDNLPEGVTLTGGLSGDGSSFQETVVLAGSEAKRNVVALAAFYGPHIRIGFGSGGGWSSFGIERIVTRSQNNILYELDGKPVLDLYKEYLGDYSRNLPSSALFFPLSIRSQEGNGSVVRTILKVDETEKSLTFAGDIPEGWYARLMKANNNALVGGAQQAAVKSSDTFGRKDPGLAIMISCVGRRLVLKQMIDDEVEIAGEVFGPRSVMTGFYSYGEIAPSDVGGISELHNQTMTITLLDEE